jgi:Cys-tRNA(Pro)/Cys-tRNA(Cys) deacylase
VSAAALALGVDEAQILKSLLFVAADGAAALAIVTGVSRVERDKLAAATGLGKLKMAAPDVVLERTGYPAGGVAPVCHATQLLVVVDERVLALAEAYAGGGSVDAMLRIAPAEIVRATGAKVADIVVCTAAHAGYGRRTGCVVAARL